MGSAHPLNAPYQAFQCADGWIVIGGSNQRTWLRANLYDSRPSSLAGRIFCR